MKNSKKQNSTKFVNGSCIGHYVKCLSCNGCKIMPVCRKEAKKKSLLKDNFATDKQKLKKLVDKIKYEKNR